MPPVKSQKWHGLASSQTTVVHCLFSSTHRPGSPVSSLNSVASVRNSVELVFSRLAIMQSNSFVLDLHEFSQTKSCRLHIEHLQTNPLIKAIPLQGYWVWVALWFNAVCPVCSPGSHVLVGYTVANTQSSGVCSVRAGARLHGEEAAAAADVPRRGVPAAAPRLWRGRRGRSAARYAVSPSQRPEKTRVENSLHPPLFSQYMSEFSRHSVHHSQRSAPTAVLEQKSLKECCEHRKK